MRNIFNNLINICKISIIRTRGINIHYSTKLISGISIKLLSIGSKLGSIEIDKNCEINKGTVIRSYGGDVHLSNNVFLGEYVIIYGHGNVTIGTNTLIAMHTCIVSSNHTIPDKSELIRSKADILMPVNIGADVWIGAGCKILGGVTIGNGCVVGAGSVVTKNLPAYSVSVGNPAKILRYRE